VIPPASDVAGTRPTLFEQNLRGATPLPSSGSLLCFGTNVKQAGQSLFALSSFGPINLRCAGSYRWWSPLTTLLGNPANLVGNRS
jgi:hypothetical protein